MGIEDDIRFIKEDIKELRGMCFSIHAQLDKLLKQQHEGVLWETKGKDLRVKDTMILEKDNTEDFQ